MSSSFSTSFEDVANHGDILPRCAAVAVAGKLQHDDTMKTLSVEAELDRLEPQLLGKSTYSRLSLRHPVQNRYSPPDDSNPSNFEFTKLWHNSPLPELLRYHHQVVLEVNRRYCQSFPKNTPRSQLTQGQHPRHLYHLFPSDPVFLLSQMVTIPGKPSDLKKFILGELALSFWPPNIKEAEVRDTMMLSYIFGPSNPSPSDPKIRDAIHTELCIGLVLGRQELQSKYPTTANQSGCVDFLTGYPEFIKRTMKSIKHIGPTHELYPRSIPKDVVQLVDWYLSHKQSDDIYHAFPHMDFHTVLQDKDFYIHASSQLKPIDLASIEERYNDHKLFPQRRHFSNLPEQALRHILIYATARLTWQQIRPFAYDRHSFYANLQACTQRAVNSITNQYGNIFSKISVSAMALSDEKNSFNRVPDTVQYVHDHKEAEHFPDFEHIGPRSAKPYDEGSTEADIRARFGQPKNPTDHDVISDPRDPRYTAPSDRSSIASRPCTTYGRNTASNKDTQPKYPKDHSTHVDPRYTWLHDKSNADINITSRPTLAKDRLKTSESKSGKTPQDDISMASSRSSVTNISDKSPTASPPRRRRKHP